MSAVRFNATIQTGRYPRVDLLLAESPKPSIGLAKALDAAERWLEYSAALGLVPPPPRVVTPAAPAAPDKPLDPDAVEMRVDPAAASTITNMMDAYNGDT